jgi:hypothetical protein
MTCIDSRQVENVSEFKYLGTTITDQNLIQEEAKRRLIFGNICYHSDQTELFVFLSVLKSWKLESTIP